MTTTTHCSLASAAAERSLERCEECLRRGQLAEAASTGRLLLGLLARLRFGSHASAAGYAALGTRCKLALKLAYDAGAPIRQEVSHPLARLVLPAVLGSDRVASCSLRFEGRAAGLPATARTLFFYCVQRFGRGQAPMRWPPPLAPFAGHC